ncbi:hypothetical protein BCR44DRAFT_26899 [Catenaria anguillulae PL171]|uniref:Myb-like domain-containing protein n=1 Tax=Catenaria anguillulae PL171 TaxID=765915 RepID=A0A1Y2I736_9FUNG|nr:hypothetical protein BCR44DRAFT_26899 [Catenaria anguillulae PL171]
MSPSPISPASPVGVSFFASSGATTPATTVNDAHTQRQNQAQVPNPIVAITDMLQDSSQLLVDYFALTEADPATAMCDADKMKLGKVMHILRQLARPAGSPASFPLSPFLSSSSADVSSSSSSRVGAANNVQQPSPLLSTVSAKRSSIPSWVIVPPGTVVPPGTPAIFANIDTTAGPDNAPKSSNHSSSSSSSYPQPQRAVWTAEKYKLLLAQVAKYGPRFRHIYNLHGAAGTESRQLAEFTVTQLTAKWHRGLARMSAADAAEWTEKAARAGEAFDEQRAAAAASAAALGKGFKLWTDDEFEFLCQQFKRIWVEHGPEGTLSQTLARFTTTQLQAKWHNAKKQRPELENLVPMAPAMDEANSADDDNDNASGFLASGRWTDNEFDFLCQQVANYGTQFKLIHELHGLAGTESQTLARFTPTQLQAKWHNAKKHKTEAELLAAYPISSQPNQTARKKRGRGGARGIWKPEEIDFLFAQVVEHGGHRGLPKIWELHGPEGKVQVV